MTKFKIGDKVTWSDRTYAREVEGRNPDEILTVSGFDSNDSQYVHLHEFPIGAYEWRFELAEEHQTEAQDNSWYENGELPPVGANIEYKIGDGPWYEATVKYVLDVLDGDEDEVVIACPHLGFEQLLTLNKHTKIRPIQTPEQIAAQERKKVIDAISDVLIETERMSSYTDVAAHLYDAGLRFVEDE